MFKVNLIKNIPKQQTPDQPIHSLVSIFMNETNNIRSQVLIPLTLTFLVLFCSFLFTSLAIRRDDISSTLDREYGESISLFKEMLYFRVEWMSAVADTFLNDPALQQAMRRKDRNALYKKARPYFLKLHANGVSHFYFHERNGRTFLRVHQPDRYGDLISRDSMQRAIKFGTPAHGIELGPFGTLTLRLVIPWKDAVGKLGFIELGTEVNDTLSDLAIINNIDYLVTINKALLDKKALATAKTWLGREQDWGPFPDRVIIAKSQDQIPPLLNHLLSQKGSAGLKEHGWQTAALGNKHFAFKTFPFRETSGREVGNFILLYDITQQTKRFHRFILQSLSFSSLLCLILFTIAWRTLGHVDRTIHDAQQKLADEITKTSEANQLLELEVAERQKAEESLIHLNTHLEERIAERTSHLETTSEELERRRIELETAYSELKSRQAMILHQDKMASIGLLAAGVAHDINNPIGFVTNNLEELREYISKLKVFIRTQRTLLSEGASTELLEKLEQNSEFLGIRQIFDDFDTLIAESLDGTARVSDIVKNLRNFSRVDDAEYMLADINECLESAIKITQHELRTKAQVHREFGNLPSIYCCPQQLDQAFMNLLVNAAHAIDKRGTVTIRTWSDTAWVHIEIADTGCGIPDEVIPRIFEPFFTTKEINKGTGLGLNIVSDIITQHRGEINVHSRQGSGTIFTIKLPNITGAGDD